MVNACRDAGRHMHSQTLEKPYSCEDGGKSFANSSDLTSHEHLHTGEGHFHEKTVVSY